MAAIAVPEIRQGTPEWLEWRRSECRVGSTDLPVLVGLSPWKSEYELALEFAASMDPAVDVALEAEVHDQREVGLLMEPVLLELYRRRTGRRARNVHRVLAMKDRPWAVASLDAETIGERPNRLVELKHSWAIRWTTKTLPEDVEVQVMWQLGVSGYPAADVMAMSHGVPRVVPVEFDQSYFDDLVAIAERFRERTIAGILPKPDGSDSARRALATRFPVDDGTFLPTTLETAAIAAELLAARSELAAAKARAGTAENAVRAVLGEATGMGTLEADGYRITWKRTADRTITDWKDYALELEAVLANGEEPPADLTGPAAIAVIRERFTHTEPGGRRLLAKFANAPEEDPE
jgi:putative phage-type endonuclease